MRFIFKICLTVTGIIMINFTNFSILFLAGFCHWAKLCGTVVAVTDHTEAVEDTTAAKIASPTFAGTRRSEQARK